MTKDELIILLREFKVNEEPFDNHVWINKQLFIELFGYNITLKKDLEWIVIHWNSKISKDEVSWYNGRSFASRTLCTVKMLDYD